MKCPKCKKDMMIYCNIFDDGKKYVSCLNCFGKAKQQTRNGSHRAPPILNPKVCTPLNYQFELTKKESQRACKFENKHRKHAFNTGAIGAGFIFTFATNSVGHIVGIKCPFCKKEADITDTSVW